MLQKTSSSDPVKKNNGPFRAFNDEWFQKNQLTLLKLLNGKYTKRLARWILRIRKSDVGYDKFIAEIHPHAYIVLNGKNDKGQLEFTADFRTHAKFGKRIYYAFRPIWWAIHFWDWAVADRYVPQWSYGFDTLTSYPQPSTGLDTVDGLVQRFGVTESFSTIRSGAGNSASTTSSSTYFCRLDPFSTTNNFNTLGRGIFTFNTSTIGSGATVSGAVISFYGSSKTNGQGSGDFHVAGATPASNNTLVNADYGQCQTTSFGSVAYASYSTSAYNDVTLDSNGIANVSKTGISKFSTQLSWDVNNNFTGTWASSGISSFVGYYADQTGTSNDPKLVVTYTPGASTIAFDDSYHEYMAGTGATHTTGSFTIGASANIAIAFFFWNGAQNFSSADIGGSAMTQIGSTQVITGTQKIAAAYLVTPPTGSTTCAFTLSGSGSDAEVHVYTFSGAKTTGQPAKSHSTSGAGTITLTVDTSTGTGSGASEDNCWLVGIARNSSAGPTPFTGLVTTESEVLAGGHGNYPRTPAGSFSVTCHATGATTGGFLVAIAPSAGGGGGSNPARNLLLLGVG